MKKNKKTDEKVNKKIGYIRLILVLLILAWVIFVYSLSNQSGTESSGLSRKVAEFLFDSEKIIDIAEPIIRKIAHFSEYAIGGVLFYSLFSTYDYSKKQKTIISLGLGIWYAAFDEIHQLFVDGRSGNIRDVCIDSLGVFFGILCMRFVFRIFENKKNKPHINKEIKK